MEQELSFGHLENEIDESLAALQKVDAIHLSRVLQFLRDNMYSEDDELWDGIPADDAPAIHRFLQTLVKEYNTWADAGYSEGETRPEKI